MRADTAEKRVADLEQQNNGFQLRLFEMEKDLQVPSCRSVNKSCVLKAYKEELASSRSSLELAHKNHK